MNLLLIFLMQARVASSYSDVAGMVSEWGWTGIECTELPCNRLFSNPKDGDYSIFAQMCVGCGRESK
jgi:hypothetical protein